MKSTSLEQMMADMNNGTYDLTCNGECTQCGNCCSNLLPMTEDEIATIRKYIKKHHIKERTSHIHCWCSCRIIMPVFLDTMFLNVLADCCNFIFCHRK